MPKLPKPPKKRKNKPSDFHEAMAVPMPQVHQMTKLADNQVRLGLYAIWALATVVVGVGAGLWLAHSGTSTAATVPGTTVASANLSVQPVAVASLAMSSAQATLPTLAVTHGASVYQATSGTPYSTISSLVYQGAEPPTALDPGFTPDLHLQGTVGTAPVK
jgi:hypothetical protein